MTDQRRDATTFGPWIDRCLVSFGPERCLLDYNRPVDCPVSSYDAIMSISKKSAGLSTDDQAAICSKNAKQLYSFNKIAVSRITPNPKMGRAAGRVGDNQVA